jgi:endonuclease/exonuclease/phosphatase family metal-dependent hydrolase
MLLLVPGISNLRNRNEKNLNLEIMTYNIRYASDQPDVHNWNIRRDGILKSFSGIDIAGLQEVLPVQVEYLRSNLPDYGLIYRSREKEPDEGEGVPLFYRKDKFLLLDSGIFWLSDTPEIPGSNTWEAACNRIATWGKFENISDNQKFFVFNTHLDHVSQYAREKSVHLILKRISELASEYPVILMGDFNVEDDNTVYQMILGNKLTDTYRDIHHQADSTDLTFHGWRDVLGLTRIDYIFVSGHFITRSSEVIRRKINGQFPSDHLPVVSKIEF